MTATIDVNLALDVLEGDAEAVQLGLGVRVELVQTVKQIERVFGGRIHQLQETFKAFGVDRCSFQPLPPQNPTREVGDKLGARRVLVVLLTRHLDHLALFAHENVQELAIGSK